MDQTGRSLATLSPQIPGLWLKLRVPFQPNQSLRKGTARKDAEWGSSALAAASAWRLGCVIQPRPQPAFHFGESSAFALREIADLVFVQLSDGEILRFWVREKQPAHAGAGPHGKTLRQLDAGVLFDVQQIPQDGLLGVVGAGGIARGRADAAIFFPDQIFVGELLKLAEAPFLAGALVQVFREGFREPISEGFNHDGVVVVVIGFECIYDRL